MAPRLQLLGEKPERYLTFALRKLRELKRQLERADKRYRSQTILAEDGTRIFLTAGPIDCIRIQARAVTPRYSVLWSTDDPLSNDGRAVIRDTVVRENTATAGTYG